MSGMGSVHGLDPVQGIDPWAQPGKDHCMPSRPDLLPWPCVPAQFSAWGHVIWPPNLETWWKRNSGSINCHCFLAAKFPDLEEAPQAGDMALQTRSAPQASDWAQLLYSFNYTYNKWYDILVLIDFRPKPFNVFICPAPALVINTFL